MAGYGGKRAGAGRKPGGKSILKKDIAADVLAAAGPKAIWKRLLDSEDDKLVFDVMKYLTDRVHGKALQVMAGDAQGGPLRFIIEGAAGAEWLKPNSD